MKGVVVISLFFFYSVDDAKTLEDDAVLLKVIEAYCTSAKTRQTVNSCKCHFFLNHTSNHVELIHRSKESIKTFSVMLSII